MPFLVVAAALTEPLQVLAFAGAVVTLRPLILGFVAMARGGTPDEIGKVVTMAAVSSVPMAVLVALSVTLYLVFG